MITLLILLVVIGAGLYLLTLVPIDETIKRIIYVLVIVIVIVYVLKNLAVLGI